MAAMRIALLMTIIAAVLAGTVSARPSKSVLRRVDSVNALGRHVGIIVPNTFEIEPLLNASIFQAFAKVPTIDIAGRSPRSRFRAPIWFHTIP
jgi:hypothetical protein